MYQTYTCLTQQHDLGLVGVAVLICLIASFTAFNLSQRALAGTGKFRVSWFVTAAVATGAGIWATHFVAMLAFETGLPTSYAAAPTVLSVVIATVLTGLGFAIAILRPSPAWLWLGGAVVGVGIGGMHFTGMTALRVPAEMQWDRTLVLSSILLGTVLASTAVRIGFNQESFKRRLAGAAILSLAIASLHFTAMGALEFTPDPLRAQFESGMSSEGLAIAVTIAASMILIFTLAGSFVDQHLARLKLAESDRLQRLVNATFEGIAIHDSGRIVDANVTLADLLGREPSEVFGASLLDFTVPEAHSSMAANLVSTSMEPFETELLRKDGRRVPVEIIGRSVEYGGGDVRVAAIRDMSERKQAEERIHHLAHHDMLTDLPNRTLFRDRLDQAIAGARRHEECVAVFCLDLDRFKQVNDLHGHAAGDELLKQVAARMRKSVREMDTIARLGGDEFAIIQPAVNQPQSAAQLAERLTGLIAEPFDLLGSTVNVGTSIGISLFPQDAQEPGILLQHADTALYRAKEEGRGTYRLFEPDMDAKLRERRALEGDLRHALAHEKLSLHYQPQSRADSGAIIGFEALVRWFHEERGAVSPRDFIPLAEETGLILSLGEWVLRKACTEAASWPAHLSISVNLSPIQLKKGDLKKLVESVLEESGLDAHRLELEITEGIFINDHEHVIEVLRALKDLGVRIVMDDFGTGYSSLSYLQRFPFDKIKIDQSFVRSLEANPDALAIVRAVIGLGHSLNVAVIAEGVETAAEGALLHREGCKELQGFLIGRPMSIENVGELLRASGAEPHSNYPFRAPARASG